MLQPNLAGSLHFLEGVKKLKGIVEGTGQHRARQSLGEEAIGLECSGRH